MDILEKIAYLEKNAYEFGFRWDTADQIMNQIESECEEIKEHLNEESPQDNKIALQEEIGDLLHAVFSLCVFTGFNPKTTIEQSLTKFERRLCAVKLIAEENGLENLKGKTFDELMIVWDRAKELVG